MKLVDEIKPGAKIKMALNGRGDEIYHVRTASPVRNGKGQIYKMICSLIKEGDPENHEVQGVGMAKGKTFTFSNVFYYEIYVKTTLKWEMVQ